MRGWILRNQRTTFLIASGLSTAGSFAGITAKGWILMHDTANPLLLALHFAALAMPSLLVSGRAGELTDRLGCEKVLIRSQWGLLSGASLGAIAIPLLSGTSQIVLLLLSTLVVGLSSAFELTARNKYCSLLVDEPQQLAPYLTSFSVVFNVGKLIGPPIGGVLLALSGPTAALSIDAASYLLPIATVVWLLKPNRAAEQRSQQGKAGSLATAWRECGAPLRHVLVFTALACLAVFFHPGLAPLIARQVLGPSPQALGLFTSVLAAGSISGGLLLQRNSHWLSRRPSLLLGGCTLLTSLAQLGMALPAGSGFKLAMSFAIGAGTAGLLAGSNLITQVAAAPVLRGRMAGLGQIAFLGGGGLSGLLAAFLSLRLGLSATFALMGGVGLVLALWELTLRPRTLLEVLENPGVRST
ncbi:MFS transporter [Synechococcus sp. CS-1324]|uniref:MFS transporter n=1 Tax=unclassified Synechococcus TaxID=2626047 RepID=UPI000DB1DD5B|nr:MULTISPECIES: MFS transporter [unclassified Synechococcus]MCT0212196.1 MFS transporter [Synechococcus sp. CS-1326]MCT0230461.1 MFS transporter [Synechococcus sp. CS-1324]MCT0233393.1 MFS transporter [Synechococcus sp. CS-1327]PZV03339.1 MAG: MFS transporter [Cyanobium sp.]